MGEGREMQRAKMESEVNISKGENVGIELLL